MTFLILIDNPEFETPSYLLIFLLKGRRGYTGRVKVQRSGGYF
jgi:hypothetical protein